jgi:curli biogenesis system outer membrane secretion channel CsgG
MRLAQIMRTALLAGAATAIAMTTANAESIKDKRDRKEAEIPVCTHKLGTLAVHEPENRWWESAHLASPEAVIKVLVMKSQCFTLVDRGKGLEAAEQERALASGGELRGGSNIGKGQIKAADYVLIPDLVSKNSDASGTNIGGILGGFVGGGAGAILSGINISKKTADVVLTLTDVRSTEQTAMTEGHADKTDVGWGVAGGWGGWGGFGGAGVSSYTNSEIGQVVILAYIDAYTKMVDQLGLLSGNASADNAAQAVSMTKPGTMYNKPGGKGGVVRKLSTGMMLYPTGEKDGVWWEVSDELGNKGWVSSLLFELSK